jgi:hypothetical protein
MKRFETNKNETLLKLTEIEKSKEFVYRVNLIGKKILIIPDPLPNRVRPCIFPLFELNDYEFQEEEI